MTWNTLQTKITLNKKERILTSTCLIQRKTRRKSKEVNQLFYNHFPSTCTTRHWNGKSSKDKRCDHWSLDPVYTI